MHIRHAQLFFFDFHLAFVINVRLGKLVLEEAFVVVPRALRRPFRKALQIFWITDWLFAAALCGLGEQRKIEPLDWLAAFDSQIGSDASFIFKARNLVTSRAPEVAKPLFTLIPSTGRPGSRCFHKAPCHARRSHISAWAEHPSVPTARCKRKSP